MMILADLTTAAPEIIVTLFSFAAILFAVYFGKDERARMLFWLAGLGMIAMAAILTLSPTPSSTAFGAMFISDGFAQFAKILILASAGIVLLLSISNYDQRDELKFEYPVLTALSVVGMMIMVSANDLLALYMGLELQSLSLYVLASFRHNSSRSTEAGLKYFVLGALSSGLLLYGISLVYGYTGHTGFGPIAAFLSGQQAGVGLLVGMVFVLIGLAFKVSAVPFHMWTPDVYQGAPTPVTAFFATAPKVAAMAMFARVMMQGFEGAEADWQMIVALLSFASMALGAIAAIGQSDIKRLMAYSSIAHMGFALMGLAAANQEGAAALALYLVIYVLMSVGTFAFILNMRREGHPVTNIRALGGYSNVDPARALALAILLFSLAGIPPLVGFFGKLAVIQAAINADLVWLAIGGVVASVIGAYYYLRIIYLMYFGEETTPLDRPIPALHLAILLACAALLAVGWLPVVNLFGLDDWSAQAAASLFG